MQHMNNEINKQLESICNKLTGTNYGCEIKIFSGKWISGNSHADFKKFESEEKTLKSIMGNDFLVGKFETVQLEKVFDELQYAFTYEGDDSSHPDKLYFNSQEYKVSIKNTKDSLKELFKKCSTISNFYIEDGHPFYPVFWDFSFLLKHEDVAYVFIGSSSD